MIELDKDDKEELNKKVSQAINALTEGIRKVELVIYLREFTLEVVAYWVNDLMRIDIKR